MRKSIIFILILLISSCAAASDGVKPKVYCHAGALVGYETEIPEYDESRYRILFDLGIKWVDRPLSFIEPLESIGISWNIAFGTEDWEVRHGIGPKLTWKLADNWSVETMAGPAFSKPRPLFKTGFHASAALIYKKSVSLDILYETLPAIDQWRIRNGDYISSIYGGLTVHGRPGTYIALSTSIIFIVAAIIVMYSVAEGLSGLN